MIKRYLWMLIVVLSFTTCIEPVEFDADDVEDFLVIDGFISPDDRIHYVYLTRSGPLNRRVYDPVGGASVTMVEEDGVSAQMIELEEGQYALLPDVLRGTVGRSYYIEVELPDGSRYRSQPEVLPVNVLLDSLSFEAGSEEFTSNNGGVLERNFVKAFVNLTIPEAESGPFFRWAVDDVYLVTEKKCGPLDNVQVCYIRPPDVTPNINLLSGTDFAAGSNFQQELARRPIDYAFGERYTFSAFQFVHTRQAFNFWSKVAQASNQSGSIFDAQPAPIRGNIYNVDNEEETVLGYFAAVTVDTAHVSITRTDVRSVKDVGPYCGPPDLSWWLAPPECCNCLNLDHSSYDRPDFW